MKLFFCGLHTELGNRNQKFNDLHLKQVLVETAIYKTVTPQQCVVALVQLFDGGVLAFLRLCQQFSICAPQCSSISLRILLIALCLCVLTVSGLIFSLAAVSEIESRSMYRQIITSHSFGESLCR